MLAPCGLIDAMVVNIRMSQRSPPNMGPPQTLIQPSSHQLPIIWYNVEGLKTKPVSKKGRKVIQGRKLFPGKQGKEIKLHVITSQGSAQHKNGPLESGHLSAERKEKTVYIHGRCFGSKIV